MQLRKLN